MRMTNDEFQAEVFRRAAAYQQRQRTRLTWVRRTALAAGCLVIALTGLAVYPKFSSKNSMMEADSPGTLNADCAPVNEAEADYSAENAESAAEEKTEQDAAPKGSREGSEADPEEADSGVDPAEDSSEELQISTPIYTNHDLQTSHPDSRFYAKTEAEMLQRYGIRPLPDTLGDFTLLKDRSDVLYSEKPQLGITTDLDDAALVQSDLSVWIYLAEDSGCVICVYLQTAQDGPSEEILCDTLQNGNGSAASFGVRGLSVYMEGTSVPQNELKAAAEELQQALA